MPGRSMISSDPWVALATPTRLSTVVPGIFDVRAREPHSRLNNVVLPVLG